MIVDEMKITNYYILDIYSINNRDLKNIRIVDYIYESIDVVTWYIEEEKLG